MSEADLIRATEDEIKDDVQEFLIDMYGSLVDVPDGIPQRMDHTRCSAGEDTKHRLYMERKAHLGNDMIVYYCHNCGEGGGMRVSGKVNHRRLAEARERKFTPSGPEPISPIDSTYLPDVFGETSFDEWSEEARDWFYQYFPAFYPGAGGPTMGLCQLITNTRGIVYKPFENKLVFPTVDPMVDHEIYTLCHTGWQERRLSGAGPKYITYKLNKSSQPTGSFVPYYRRGEDRSPGLRAKTLVITEDYISACACAHQDKIDALALMGTHIDAERLLKLSKLYEKIVIWLDNDNAQVITASISMARKLEMFGKCSVWRITHPTRDPKRYNSSEIHNLITNGVL